MRTTPPINNIYFIVKPCDGCAGGVEYKYISLRLKCTQVHKNHQRHGPNKCVQQHHEQHFTAKPSASAQKPWITVGGCLRSFSVSG